MKLSRKSIVVIAIAAGLLAGITLGFARLIGTRQSGMPDFSRQKPERIAAYLESEKFAALEPNTRRLHARRAFRQLVTAQAAKYSALPPEEKEAYLDKVIDSIAGWRERMRTMRGRFEPGRMDPNDFRRRRGPNGRGRRRWAKPEDRRRRREFIRPEQRAQMRAFRQAMRERMRQRGIESPFRRPR